MTKLLPLFRRSLALLPLLAGPMLGQDGRGAVNHDALGLGAHGYDLVAYQTESRAVPGEPQFMVLHQGVVYRFTSATNRNAFVADPDRYLPAYGGYAVMGVVSGKKRDPDPTIWNIWEGRLYLNDTEKAHKNWIKDPVKHLEMAEKKWPAVALRPGFDK